MINHGSLDNLKARSNVNNELWKYLPNQNVGHNESEAQHDWHIKYTDKVSIGVKSENSKFCIKWKLAAPKKIAECDEIES